MTRCPLCRDNTAKATKARPERCVRPDCTAQHIERNNRGDAWAWDHTGRLVYKPNRHPLPVDTEVFVRQHTTADPTHDDAFLARMFGTTGFSVRTKEARI